MKIGIYDHTTGKQTVRDATPEEVANRQAEIAISSAEDAKNRADAEATYLHRVSAFQKMGLTPAEIAVMVAKPYWLE